VKILPKTSTGSNNGRNAARRACPRLPHDARGHTGHCCRQAWRAMRSISTPASVAAGKNPARNRAVTERLAIVARRTISRQGGTRIPMAAAALTMATASARR
jgi:hypothetical protein